MMFHRVNDEIKVLAIGDNHATFEHPIATTTPCYLAGNRDGSLAEPLLLANIKRVRRYREEHHSKMVLPLSDIRR